MADPIFDTSQSPLVVIRFQGAMTDDQYRAYLVETMRIMLDTPRSVLICDTREATGVSQAQRRMQADWMKANETLIKLRVAAMVFVIDSTFIRGILTAILWLQPLPIPHRVLKTMDDARAWATDKLRAAA